MFIFEKEQYVYDIADVRIGGMPGENPTVLAGTIFYSGDKIVEDPHSGVFDQSKAETRIKMQEEMSDKTGNPALVHIFSESSDAAEEYIDFVSSVTDSPFLIDSTDSEVRIQGLRHAQEVGLLDKTVYNSLNISVSKDEIEALKEIGHDCAIVLAFNPQDPSVAGRRAVLEDGAGDLEVGLLPLSNEIGIDKPLIDTATTSMGSGAGSAAAFTFVSKATFGHPTGSGMHNAPSSWGWVKEQDEEIYRTCDAASNLIGQILGADYLLYGPIENAESVFPVVAMGDIFAAEALSNEFGIEAIEDHPYRRLL
ncbi:MAG: tetrahydromethanopterin S-methyltransferase subunit H [Candidatus Thorarchaeota archaeon]|nr:tetrahydromethanopterin S-methyltransferase subunit H [Candidatus Thorarchaeota archaeon]